MQVHAGGLIPVTLDSTWAKRRSRCETASAGSPELKYPEPYLGKEALQARNGVFRRPALQQPQAALQLEPLVDASHEIPEHDGGCVHLWPRARILGETEY